jgi:hypothetical protein
VPGGEKGERWNGAAKANKASLLWTQSGDESLPDWETKRCSVWARPIPLLLKRPGARARKGTEGQGGRKLRAHAPILRRGPPKSIMLVKEIRKGTVHMKTGEPELRSIAVLCISRRPIVVQ